MLAQNERRVRDMEKLRDLCKLSNGKLSIISTKGNPIDEIVIELKYITVPSIKYPIEKSNNTRVNIQLSSRYPFQEPSATITTKILHPNVYTSGRICLGTKWIPTEGLDLLIKRIVQIVTYDAKILNEKSPANWDALNWYKSVKERYPNAFPTDSYSFNNPENSGRISWSNLR